MVVFFLHFILTVGLIMLVSFLARLALTPSLTVRFYLQPSLTVRFYFYR